MKYSITTDTQFIPRLTKMAVSVEIPSMIAMKKGPMSLQIKSMRLICEFIAVVEVSSGNLEQLVVGRTNLEVQECHCSLPQ